MNNTPLENLETQLEMFIKNVRQNRQINGIKAGLKVIDKLCSQVVDVYVPLDVCYEYIDKNKNPLMFTKDVLPKTEVKNEEIKGKVEGFEKCKSNMIVELFKTFPDEMESYRAYRNEALGSGDNTRLEPSFKVTSWIKNLSAALIATFSECGMLVSFMFAWQVENCSTSLCRRSDSASATPRGSSPPPPWIGNFPSDKIRKCALPNSGAKLTGKYLVSLSSNGTPEVY